MQTVEITPVQEPPAGIDWCAALPVLRGSGVTVRGLRLSDAPTLLAMLNSDEVSRFISPPPTSVEGFERFIAWTQRERALGRYYCFGVVPDGFDQAIGIIQVRQLSASFDVAEWGFAIGRQFWGTGVFAQAARKVLEFTFDTIGVLRLEARSSVGNGRGNGALQKMGAAREGVLRRSFLREEEYHDQILWSILAADWQQWVAASIPATVH